MHKIFYLNFLNINICGGRQGGSGPPTPGVQPPYRCPIFSSYPHPIFSPFFRVPPPQIHILLPPPPAHLTPAHFSPKAPTPAPLIPGPNPPIPHTHTHTSVSVSISITGNQLALGFVLLCVLCNIIMISSTCAMTMVCSQQPWAGLPMTQFTVPCNSHVPWLWFVPNNHGQGCPWRNSQCNRGLSANSLVCDWTHSGRYRDCKCGKPFRTASEIGRSPHLVAVTWKYKKPCYFTIWWRLMCAYVTDRLFIVV